MQKVLDIPLTVCYIRHVGWLKEISHMTEEEYKEMYTEFAAEAGARMSAKGFAEFKAWRKRVEELFAERDAKSA